jgi:hypothetical protein
LVGLNDGTVSNSFWDTQTSGLTTSAAGIEMTTKQMQTRANFTSATKANGFIDPDWDFNNVWTMKGHSYPQLRTFVEPKGKGQ